MLAAGMICGKPGSYAFDLPRPEIQQADQVLVRVKEVGLDGTDFGMVSRGQPDIAEGRNEVVMGYEMVGVVEAVGAWVTKLAASDTVTMTVRRWCGICHPCLHNQSDMCMTGLFTERGIHKIDGFLTRFVVGQEQYIVKEPANQVWCGVLTEPLSIAEKGVEQIRFIQARIVWACSNPSHSFDLQTWGGCRTGLVVGVRPLGILGTALLRLAGVDTYVADIVPEYSAKAQLVKQMGARYIHGRTKTPQ